LHCGSGKARPSSATITLQKSSDCSLIDSRASSNTKAMKALECVTPIRRSHVLPWSAALTSRTELWKCIEAAQWSPLGTLGFLWLRCMPRLLGSNEAMTSIWAQLCWLRWWLDTFTSNFSRDPDLQSVNISHCTSD
jgi:hypothetical protein